jgi:diadenosine tetraphosphatase ApaH/serine/threonine PP2A family protein phosphatase
VRVAALYDVHGNAPALEAVLAEVDSEGVDEIVFGGDIVAGPLPLETLELVLARGGRWIRGNAERLDSPAPSAEMEEDRQWLKGQLGDERVEWLGNLPFSAVLDDVLYVHATPQDDMTVITELTTDERLAELLEGVEQELVVAGHTHMQLDRTVGGRRFVNAGSVGRPYDAAPDAYWATVEDGTVEFRHTEYDLERAAALTRDSGHPQAAELADENVLTVPSREEALAVFGG